MRLRNTAACWGAVAQLLHWIGAASFQPCLA